MKVTRICLAMIILICAIGIVAAEEVSDIKVATGYENLGNGSYTNNAENIAIDIYSEKEIGNLSEEVTNDTDAKYTVMPGKLNNTFNFTDGINEMTGIVELVKIDEQEYSITFSTDTNSASASLDKIYDVLEEFNKLNNLEPLDPSTLNS